MCLVYELYDTDEAGGVKRGRLGAGGNTTVTSPDSGTITTRGAHPRGDRRFRRVRRCRRCHWDRGRFWGKFNSRRKRPKPTPKVAPRPEWHHLTLP